MTKMRIVVASVLLAMLGMLGFASVASATVTNPDRHYYVVVSACSMPKGTFTNQPVGRLRTHDGAITKAWTRAENSDARPLRAIHVVNANSGRVVFRLDIFINGIRC